MSHYGSLVDQARPNRGAVWTVWLCKCLLNKFDESTQMNLRDVSAAPLSDIISLAGRAAVVTGAAWGLGKATARRLAEAGASVLIGDIDVEKAAATAKEIREAYGVRVLSVAMDVTNREAVVAAADL